MISRQDENPPVRAGISIEQNYAANSDFGRTRLINHEHELVDYQNISLNRIWLNIQDSCFAPHWHSAMEIIQPVENSYVAICGDIRQEILPGQIFLIPPRLRHELVAPANGKRYIYLLNISAFTKLQGFSQVMSVFSQPLLLSRQDEGDTYETISDLLEQIRDEYFNEKNSPT